MARARFLDAETRTVSEAETPPTGPVEPGDPPVGAARHFRGCNRTTAASQAASQARNPQQALVNEDRQQDARGEEPADHDLRPPGPPPLPGAVHQRQAGVRQPSVPPSTTWTLASEAAARIRW